MEDIYRCVDRREAEALLSDTYAEEELVRLISERYGDVEESFLINYDIEQVLRRSGALTMRNTVQKDIVNDFENTIKQQGPVTINEDDESFESLMTVSPELEKAARAKPAKIKVDQSKILD